MIFRQGAGHVDPNIADDPGLVFDSGFEDWLGFLCGTQLPASFCTTSVPPIPVLDASDFNVPSIAIGDLPGAQTVKRTVTSVGHGKETYTASIIGLTGVNVTLPAPFDVDDGKKNTKSFNITFTNVSAALTTYVGGYLVLTGDKGHVVRIPVVIRPVALSAPVQVSGSYSVKFGYTGAFSASARGLVPATATAGGPVHTGEGPSPAERPSLFSVGYDVRALLAVRCDDHGRQRPRPLCVPQRRAGGGERWRHGGGRGQLRQSGRWDLSPFAWTPSRRRQAGSTYTEFHWVLGTTAAGNMAVTAPASAVIGTTGAIGLTFSGLTPGTKYLGSVAYTGPAGVTLPNPTIVRIDP